MYKHILKLLKIEKRRNSDIQTIKLIPNTTNSSDNVLDLTGDAVDKIISIGNFCAKGEN